MAESCRAVLGHLVEICTRKKVESVTVSIAKHFLVFEDRPLLGASLSASRLIGALTNWKSGGLTLYRRAGIDDLQALMSEINATRREDDGYEAINERLAIQSNPARVVLLPPYQEGVRGGGRGTTPTDVSQAKCFVPLHMYQSVMDLLEGITVSVSTGGTIDFAPVQEHAETMLRRLDTSEGPLVNLARQDQYDAFTFGHSVRVSVLALNFGRALTDDVDALVRRARQYGWRPRFLISTIIPTEVEGTRLTDYFPVHYPELYYSLYSFNLNWRKRWLPRACHPRIALEMLKRWQDETGKIPKIHYAFIHGENDSRQDVAEICEEINRLKLRVNVNIVRYNPPDETSRESDDLTLVARQVQFSQLLGASTRVDEIQRVGFDVAASCGMFVSPTGTL